MTTLTSNRILSILITLLFLTGAITSGQSETANNEKTEMLYRRGLAAYKAKDFTSAESFFEQALEVSYSPDAAVYLTYIRKETGDFRSGYGVEIIVVSHIGIRFNRDCDTGLRRIHSLPAKEMKNQEASIVESELETAHQMPPFFVKTEKTSLVFCSAASYLLQLYA
jgi:hypothetical protein